MEYIDVSGDGFDTARRIQTRAGLLLAISKADQECASLVADLATCPNLTDRERAEMEMKAEAYAESARLMRAQLDEAAA